MSGRAKYDIMRGVDSADGGRFVARNTVRYTRHDGTIVTRLHDTDIVEHHPDGTITLNTDGWQTVTTKDRMNAFMESRREFGRHSICWRVYSHKGVWHLYKCNSDRDKYSGPWAPFRDGMRFDPATGKVDGMATEDELAEILRLRALCNALGRQVVESDALPQPSNGDCWGCLMQTDDGKRPMGDDCVRQHVEEGYLHGSLIIRAMEWAGYRPEGIALAFHGHFPRGQIASAVRRFCLRQCGLDASSAPGMYRAA